MLLQLALAHTSAIHHTPSTISAIQLVIQSVSNSFRLSFIRALIADKSCFCLALSVAAAPVDICSLIKPFCWSWQLAQLCNKQIDLSSQHLWSPRSVKFRPPLLRLRCLLMAKLFHLTFNS